jgi:hypothetical protein
MMTKSWHLVVILAVSFSILWPLSVRLLSYIKSSKKHQDFFLELKQSIPLFESDSYNLTKHSGNSRGSWSQEGQDLCVSLMLKNMTVPGFFLEAGAYDGETHSNTLYFEKNLNWSGILVEPNPHLFEKLLTRRRKAKAINAGLFIQGEQLNPAPFRLVGPYSGFISQTNDKQRTNIKHYLKHEHALTRGAEASERIVMTPMYSLEQILKAAHKTDLVVDYLSLDTEGSELGVLKAINFTTVTIGVISVEHNGGASDMQKAAAIDSYMTSVGFTRHKAVNTNLFRLDHIYYNPRYFRDRKWMLPADVRCFFDDPATQLAASMRGKNHGGYSRGPVQKRGGEERKSAQWAEAAKAVPKRARSSAEINYIEKPHVDKVRPTTSTGIPPAVRNASRNRSANYKGNSSAGRGKGASMASKMAMPSVTAESIPESKAKSKMNANSNAKTRK